MILKKGKYMEGQKTLKELRTMVGMTQKEFSEYFGIPKRTIEDWERGARKYPQYLIELMEYKLIKEGILNNYAEGELQWLCYDDMLKRKEESKKAPKGAAKKEKERKNDLITGVDRGVPDDAEGENLLREIKKKAMKEPEKTKKVAKMVRKERAAAKKNDKRKEVDCGGLKTYDPVEPPETKEERRFRIFLMDYDYEIEECKKVLASDALDDYKKDAKMRLKEAEKQKKYMLKNKDKLLGKSNEGP
jgi:transcriptional regulator with XRE-family HTH domain